MKRMTSWDFKQTVSKTDSSSFESHKYAYSMLTNNYKKHSIKSAKSMKNYKIMVYQQFLPKLFSIVIWKSDKLLETVKAVVKIVKTIFTKNACIIMNWIQNGTWLNLAKEIIFSLKTLKFSLSLTSLSQNSYSKRTTVSWHLKNKNKKSKISKGKLLLT